ncbi:phage antirepressor N-terminal domain-containing protein [Rhodococcus erythropolis]|uniref:phage antirepressor N-terminal domain-containing protein n=1 Tax=Rhodococcus erythropolis TaxID=1833 RepID=UPI002949AC14|nr:phage antirepressor N-terminal domain-containing protein [Rhodococcus erythropolis]MDV6277972.1 phage antirepressor N-terminal domain-containing protein [Rhodococcus erythropolis]
MSVLTNIPVAGTPGILGAEIEGEAIAAFRPIVEMLGLGYSSQLQKLKSKSWACGSNKVTPDNRGRRQDKVWVARKNHTK